MTLPATVEPLTRMELIATYARMAEGLDLVIEGTEPSFAFASVSAALKLAKAIAAANGVSWPDLDDEIAANVARLDQVQAALADLPTIEEES